MYQIIKDGTPLALVERPNYIYKHTNGCYVLCSESEATGVAVDGAAYHLVGKAEMEGLDSVVMVETDGGKELTTAQSESDEGYVDHELRLTLLELGVTTDEGGNT